jgi:hypothetical protein
MGQKKGAGRHAPAEEDDDLRLFVLRETTRTHDSDTIFLRLSITRPLHEFKPRIARCNAASFSAWSVIVRVLAVPLRTGLRRGAMGVAIAVDMRKPSCGMHGSLGTLSRLCVEKREAGL